jgi:hypothetical protein
MSACFRQLDPRARRLMVAGNLSLALALVLWNFTQHFRTRYPWFDGVCGFFFGVSIAINLLTLRRVRRCRTSEARIGD